MRNVFVLGFLFCSIVFGFAGTAASKKNSRQELVSVRSFNFSEKKKPNHLVIRIRKMLQRSRRVTAAVLAFPLPFGILALHRIYMGTKPYVPLAYIATAGGVLGILPFIDFCVLLLDADPDRFYNNGKVFMWIK
jgi:hypothetical protein